MASGSDLGDRSRFAKLGMAIAEELTQACRDVLETEVPPQHLYNKVKSSSLSKRIHSEQGLVLKNAETNGYKDFDISLLYILIRHICVMIPRPTKGKWGLNKMPSVGEITIGDDIERIRLIRNTYFAHRTSASTSKKEFDEIWSVISDVCQRLQTYTGKDYMSAFIEEDEESAEEKLKENMEESIPPHYIEKLEKSLRENAIITVQHSRGILIGCAEAGKTTLLNRLMGETQEVVEDKESTRGLEVHHHVFNIRNGHLEVSADERRQKSFLWVGISDLNTDTDVKTDSSKSKKIDSNTQIIYQREEGEGKTSVEIERELDEEQEKTSDSSVQSDTEPFTIPREILLKIMDDKEKIPTISMLDLAGQFAYYACHQIYITKGVFFILVLNVNQKFEDKVSTEENNQEGSVFSTWTYKEYVKFWINSIKTFGGTRAPVLIVATHTEEKSEGEINEFFAQFWEAVPEEDRDWLIESLVDFEYDIGLLNLDEIGNETLESIKSSIIKAATEKINNKIDVPSTWALLEQVVKEKRRKVMSYEEIWEVNTKRFPSEFQLENKAMLSGFLNFFHRHGLLLWFEEGNMNDNHLQQKVILDIQWFASAVNKLIADKNHIHKDCKRRYYREWCSFNKTGKIEEKLVMNLWKDESSYLNHKTEIMTYMEKLLMLVALHSKNDVAETDKSWYVPSMNKQVYKEDFSEETCQYSSILCFRFSSFAMFVYYRVVAYCMSVLKWTVSRDEESLCLYQTAAVFDFKNHTVIIGISENDIQVQVKLIKPSVIQTDISAEVGESVEVACKNLAKTFHEDIHFVKGYKCRRIFCDVGDRSFTPAIELANEKGEIQCQYCSVTRKHTINVEETLQFWKKVDEDIPKEWLNLSILENLTVKECEMNSEEFQRSKCYKMGRHSRGKVLIINNEIFNTSGGSGTGANRQGAKQDERNIKSVFEQLKFTVDVLNNLKGEEIKTKLKEEVEKEIHRTADCFVLVISTHGTKGAIYGTDFKTVSTKEIKKQLNAENFRAMADKPKVILIQACRGGNEDKGVEKNYNTNKKIMEAKEKLEIEISKCQTDSLNEPRVSTWGDMIVGKSTTEGMVSYRHPKYGSWFLQAIALVLAECSYKDDIFKILTKVNDLVSEWRKEKQNFVISKFSSTLSKDLYFRPVE